MMNSLKNAITKKYSQYKGRANRAELWQFGLVFFVITLGLILLKRFFVSF